MAPEGILRDFLLPDLGEGLEDAELVEWHVQVGDVVALNQPLCTVETAKATVEIPSPFAGRIVERVGEPGATIDVGTLLVRIEEAAPDEPSAPAASTRRPTLVGYGPEEGPSRRRARPGRSRPAATTTPSSAPAAVLAKPPVRKLARELGVDLTAVAPGTGPSGVVTRDDVTRAASAAPSDAETQQQTKQPETERVAWSAPAPVRPGDVIPVEGVRARIAERMTLAHSTIPDAACSVTVDCARLVEMRATLREVARERADADVLTPFALILRLVVAALRARPVLNATFDEEARQIRVHEAINLGVGTDTPRGLLVPVVRDADRLSTLELATEVRRLAEGARAGTLSPGELTGSTFTVSNFGVFGLDDGYPVINHPEVAILGIGAIRERPAVVDGEIVARPTANLTCSFDHRACDGADAGAFLGHLRELIEAPEQLILDT